MDESEIRTRVLVFFPNVVPSYKAITPICTEMTAFYFFLPNCAYEKVEDFYTSDFQTKGRGVGVQSCQAS